MVELPGKQGDREIDPKGPAGVDVDVDVATRDVCVCVQCVCFYTEGP